jgi:hypothetical protein
MDYRLIIKRVALFVIVFLALDFLISIALINGLNKFYGLDHKSEILINGSSMSMSGFNRHEIEVQTGMKVANYSHEGASIIERMAMIRHFFRENRDKVNTVIYEVNPVMFSGNATAENVYTIFYPFLDNDIIDSYVRENATLREYLIHKIVRTKRFESRLIRYAGFGYLGKFEKVKSVGLDTTNMEDLKIKSETVKIRMDSSRMQLFESTIDFIKEQHADIILVMMPMYRDKLRTFDPAGLQRINDYFQKVSLEDPNVAFINLNTDSLINNSRLFSDPLHCNLFGQRQVTNLISTYLNSQRSDLPDLRNSN